MLSPKINPVKTKFGRVYLDMSFYLIKIPVIHSMSMPVITSPGLRKSLLESLFFMRSFFDCLQTNINISFTTLRTVVIP